MGEGRVVDREVSLEHGHRWRVEWRGVLAGGLGRWCSWVGSDGSSVGPGWARCGLSAIWSDQCVRRSWSAEGGRAGCAVTSTCLDMAWSGRGGVGIRVACFVGTCLDMAWSWRGVDGIRVACFLGPAVLDEVHARVGHAQASDGSVPRRGRGASLKGVL